VEILSLFVFHYGGSINPCALNISYTKASSIQGLEMVWGVFPSFSVEVDPY
jgi:hypothetical protein